MIHAPDDLPRQTAHVLIDMAAAAAIPDTEQTSTDDMVRTAFARLSDLDAVRVTSDDETGELHVDMTPILLGSGVLIEALISLAERDSTGVRTRDRDAVIFEIRAFVDRVLG